MIQIAHFEDGWAGTRFVDKGVQFINDAAVSIREKIKEKIPPNVLSMLKVPSVEEA